MKYPVLIATVALFSGPLTAEAGAQQRPSTPTPAQYAAARMASNDIRGSRYYIRDIVRRHQMDRLFQNPAAASRIYDRSLTLAGCMVGLSGERASAFVGGPSTKDPQYSNLSRAMIGGRYGGCMRNDDLSALSPRLLSSAIAERFVVENYGATYADRAAQVNVDHAASFHGDLNGPVTIVNIARCAAVYSPGLVRKVMDTRSGSAEEKGALDALYARTPECGISRPPADISPTVQRAALAGGLYEWARQDSSR
jgi:hypothetical protein